MLKKTLVALVLGLLLIGCAIFKHGANETTQAKGQPPVILDHYAAPEIRPGDTWKIFLHLRDEDGDMQYIVAELYQAGVGFYQVAFVPAKEGDRAEVAGYLFQNIPYDPTFFMDRFDLRVLARDRQGNRSAAVNISLIIGNRPPEEIPEKWETAAKHLLGGLLLNLESSQYYNRGGDNLRHR